MEMGHPWQTSKYENTSISHGNIQLANPIIYSYKKKLSIKFLSDRRTASGRYRSDVGRYIEVI